MITETKAKQKAKKNYSKKSVLSPFSVKTKKEFKLALWFQPLLIIYNFVVVILFSVFEYAHVRTPHVVKKQLFSSKTVCSSMLGILAS